MGGLAGAAGGGSAACAWAAPAWWLAPLLLLGAGAGAWAHAWSGRAVRTSVLAVRGVGVQLRSERRSGACCHQAFVPAERIAHAVVNECVEFESWNETNLGCELMFGPLLSGMTLAWAETMLESFGMH